MADQKNPIIEALEGYGLTVLETEQAAIEAKLDGVNKEVVPQIANALVKALPTNGVAGLLDKGLATAIVAAEPTLEGALGAAEHNLIGEVENFLKAQTGQK